MQDNAYTAASFFTGIGGLDLAAEAAGFTVVAMCEIDPYARAVLRRHWPTVKLYEDIKDVSGNELHGIDLIFGGFPCQDISVAGNGRGLEGDRSGLWFELARIISEVRPRIVVLENVPAINVRGGTTVVAQLAAAGYDCLWTTYPAEAFGTPQHRKRWFLVGYANSIRRSSKVSTKVFSCDQRWYNETSDTERDIANASQSAGESCRVRRRASGIGARFKSRLGRNADGLSGWVDIHSHQWPSGSWLPQQAHEPLRLTPDYEGRADRVRCLGNAVVPQQAYPIFAAAIRMLQRVSETSIHER